MRLDAKALQLRVNELQGITGEVSAAGLQRSMGEFYLNTQYRQGAVLRGFESISVAETCDELLVIINEVKSTNGLVAPWRPSVNDREPSTVNRWSREILETLHSALDPMTAREQRSRTLRKREMRRLMDGALAPVLTERGYTVGDES